MKKFNWISMALLAVAVVLSSCKDPHILKSSELDEVIQVGYYVVGPATTVASENADNFYLGLMGGGINEKNKIRRPGLYEKYVVLEADKPFEILKVDEYEVKHYGGALTWSKPHEAYDGNGIQDSVWIGTLQEGATLNVKKFGLYHIAIDMNEMGDLGVPMIVVSPVSWQLPQMDSKVMQLISLSQTSATWLVRGQLIESDDKNFKFAWGNGWKVPVDPSQIVCLESNLGVGMKSGATDIPIGKGRWNIFLTWNLASGAIEKSFSYALVPFEGEYITDYSNTVLEIYGTENALIDKRADSLGSRSKEDPTLMKSIPLGLPTKVAENEYRWYCDSVALNIDADSLAVRTLHGKASGESDALTISFKVAQKGIYSVEYIRNAVDASKNKLTFTYKGEVPRSPEDYTNFANCELELIGYAIDATQTGYEVTTRKVKRDTYNRIQIGKPATVSNYVYIWTATGVNLLAGGKTVMVATKDGQTYTDANGHSVTQWIGTVAATYTPAADGTYNITVTIDAKPEKPTPAISVN